jgi:hypothetical protein
MTLAFDSTFIALFRLHLHLRLSAQTINNFYLI